MLESIIKLLKYNTIGYLLIFITSIIIFRTVDKSSYGLYVLVISFFAISDLILSGVNESIVKLLKEYEGNNKAKQILKIAYQTKLLVIFFIFSLLITLVQYGILIDFFNIEKTDEVLFIYFIYIGFISNLIGGINGIISSILNSIMQYESTAKISFIKSFFYLILVISLTQFTNEYIFYLILNLILSFVFMLFLVKKVLIFRPQLHRSLFKEKINISFVKREIMPYFFPLQGVSLLSYIKNHIPVIFLGNYTSLEQVASFSIIKLFFKNIHTLASSFFYPMTSKFIELSSSKIVLRRTLEKIMYYSFGARFAILTLLIIFNNEFLSIYGINNDREIQLVSFIFGLEFLVSGVIHCFNVPLRLEKNTLTIFKIAFFRAVFELILIFTLIEEFGAIGAAIVFFLSRMFETIVAYFYVLRFKLFNNLIWLVISFLFIAIYISI